MHFRTLPLAHVFALVAGFTACQSLSKKNQDDGAAGGVEQAVKNSIQAGIMPKPLVTMANMGDESPDTADSALLKSWMNDDHSFYVKSIAPTTSTGSMKVPLDVDGGFACALSHLKVTVQAKGELVALVMNIDARSCESKYRADAEKYANSIKISPDNTNGMTAVNLTVGYPLELQSISAFQCLGANLTSLNGTVISSDNDLRASDNPFMMKIRKACTYQDTWSQPMVWSYSLVSRYYRMAISKTQGQPVVKNEFILAEKKGTMSSQTDPCRMSQEGSDFVTADCVIFTSTKFIQSSGKDSNSEPYRSILRATNLRRSGEIFYKSGVVNFEKGPWKGALTYTSGSIAPEWNATDSSGNTASGTISAGSSSSDGFSLQGESLPKNTPWQPILGF